MKFHNLVNGSKNSRTGVLSELYKLSELFYKTPLAVLTTKGGTVPHLTRDVLYKVTSEDVILSISAKDFIDIGSDVLKMYQDGISCFMGLKGHPVSVSVQDSMTLTPSGYNDSKIVSVWGARGRVRLSPHKFTELLENVHPQWYECLNDADVDVESTQKRNEKSMRNTLKFLKECQQLKKDSQSLNEVGFFIPLLGGHSVEKRIEWAKTVATMECDGYSLLALHKNGEATEHIQPSTLSSLVQASLNSLNTDKAPIQAKGAFAPSTILELVECGCDIFDSSLPTMVTERNCAFVFVNKLAILSQQSRPDLSKFLSHNLETKRSSTGVEDMFESFTNKDIQTTTDAVKNADSDIENRGDTIRNSNTDIKNRVDTMRNNTDIQISADTIKNTKLDIENRGDTIRNSNTDIKNRVDTTSNNNTDRGPIQNTADTMSDTNADIENRADTINIISDNRENSLDPKRKTAEPLKGNISSSDLGDDCSSKESAKDETYIPKYYEINLKDQRFSKAYSPIVEECQCYCCQNFTMAYIHHLVSVREMLGQVLLAIHNLHHWLQFFSTIRQAIEEERMDELKRLVNAVK